MKRLFFLISLLLIFPTNNAFALFRPVEGLDASQAKCVAISPFDSDLIYAASKNSLYQSQDSAKTFKKIAVFKDEEVQQIFFDPYFANTVYVATSRHLYRWKERLEVLFSAPDDEFIYSAARYKQRIYIGTNQGLHFALEDVLIWHKLKNLNNATIHYIEPSEEGIYLATDRGVFVLKSKDRIRRLLVMRKDQEEGSQMLTAKIIKTDLFDKSNLWLGTSRGLYRSLDLGKSWKKAYISGIGSLSINCIVQTPLQDNTLYLGTTRGFFKVNFRKKTSRQIFEGLYSDYIWWVTFTAKGKIYLATSKGLFDNDYFAISYQSKSLEAILKKESSIQEIQQVVLDYNEVHPDKINKWRNAVKYKALFPNVSLDYDKTVYGSSSGNFAIGPYDWGINFKWDVGDLIWNPSQTSIDTRSRLNTQLRLDILDELNRVYFERLRLKNEIAGSSLSDEELFSKNLRLRELTAIIDGYSGGYFSERIKEFNE